MRLMIPIGIALALLGGCSAHPPPSAVQPSPSFASCRDAFAGWVAGAASLNSPGTDLIPTIADQEQVQRRVFELCGLDEAESLNRELQVEYVPGLRQPLIDLASVCELLAGELEPPTAA